MELTALKPLILLSGPPGAGKTTVAQELRAILPGPVACIEEDKFWSFFPPEASSEDADIKSNFKTIMTSMTSASLAYVRAGYQVIIDFSIPPWFIPTAFKIANDRKIALDYIVIRPSEEVCAKRATCRAEGAVTDYSVYKKFYASFDKAACYTIFDDEGDAALIAAHILEGLQEGVFRVTE